MQCAREDEGDEFEVLVTGGDSRAKKPVRPPKKSKKKYAVPPDAEVADAKNGEPPRGLKRGGSHFSEQRKGQTEAENEQHFSAVVGGPRPGLQVGGGRGEVRRER